MKTLVYRRIAQAIEARLRCIADAPTQPHLQEWIDRHAATAWELTHKYLPSGGGFDCATKIDLYRSTGEKLVFTTSFHHMDENGSYVGWTEHTVTVRASLIHGITLQISGRDRNNIKDYVAESFDFSLIQEIEGCHHEN